MRRGPLCALLALVAALATPSAALADGEASGCVLDREHGTARDYTCRYGPITVGPYQVRQELSLDGVPTPSIDGSVTAMDVDVTDASGTPVPINRLMLHHIVFTAIGRPNPECDQYTMWDNKTKLPGNLAQPFYGAGEERARFAVPQGYGYPVQAGERWGLAWMFMNHKGRTDRAWITYHVTVDTAQGLTALQPHWLDVRNCSADPVFDVAGGGPPGSEHVETYDWVPPENGRMIVGGGHMHGGGKRMEIVEPACGDAVIARSRPTWGAPDHPFYQVKPVLHEPGPINMSGFGTAQGIPVRAGEPLRMRAVYDAERPHTRVMGIMVVYVAPGDPPAQRCAPPPGDLVEVGTTEPGRTEPPPFTVPLTGLDRRGRAVKIDRPPGEVARLDRGTTIRVRDLSFSRPNLSVPVGTTLRWRFGAETLHNVTVADGPRGFSSPNLSEGRAFREKLDRPGTYRLFCALHPVEMTQSVVVRR